VLAKLTIFCIISSEVRDTFTSYLSLQFLSFVTINLLLIWMIVKGSFGNRLTNPCNLILK
jgi:hypothetical protein